MKEKNEPLTKEKGSIHWCIEGKDGRTCFLDEDVRSAYLWVVETIELELKPLKKDLAKRMKYMGTPEKYNTKYNETNNTYWLVDGAIVEAKVHRLENDIEIITKAFEAVAED